MPTPSCWVLHSCLLFFTNAARDSQGSSDTWHAGWISTKSRLDFSRELLKLWVPNASQQNKWDLCEHLPKYGATHVLRIIPVQTCTVGKHWKLVNMSVWSGTCETLQVVETQQNSFWQCCSRTITPLRRQKGRACQHTPCHNCAALPQHWATVGAPGDAWTDFTTSSSFSNSIDIVGKSLIYRWAMLISTSDCRPRFLPWSTSPGALEDL